MHSLKVQFKHPNFWAGNASHCLCDKIRLCLQRTVAYHHNVTTIYYEINIIQIAKILFANELPNHSNY